MSVLTAGILGFQLALLVIIGIPVLIAPYFGPDNRKRIGDKYDHMAMFILDRALIVRRNAGIDLFPSTFDPDRGGEKITMGSGTVSAGSTRYFEDPHNFMRSFMNKPFGLASEKKASLIHPAVAEIADYRRQQKLNDEHVIHDVDFGKLFTSYVKIPNTERIVELSEAPRLNHGAETPADSDKAYKLAMESQRLFHPFETTKKGILLITAFVAGYGVVWFGKTQGTSGTSFVENVTPVTIINDLLLGVVL